MLHAHHIPEKPPHPPRSSWTSIPSTTFPTLSNSTSLTRQMASHQDRMTLLPIPIPPQSFLPQIHPSSHSLSRLPHHGALALGAHKTTRHLQLLLQYRLPQSPRSYQQRQNSLGLKSHGLYFLFLLASLSSLIFQTTRKTCRCTTSGSSTRTSSFST